MMGMPIRTGVFFHVGVIKLFIIRILKLIFVLSVAKYGYSACEYKVKVLVLIHENILLETVMFIV